MPDVDAQVSEDVLSSALLERITSPIKAGSPAGDDVTYEDDFQRVKMEIDKLESASASIVDYGLVVELSDKILSERSKDLRAAAYLAMGLAKMEGLRGAVQGVVAVNRLTQTFWEDLYPALQRMRARRNALQALSDRLKELVAAAKPTVDDRDMLEAAAREMKSLQEFVLEKMGEDAPAVSGLTRAFEEAVRRVASQQQGPQPAQTTAPAGNGPAPSSSQPEVAAGDFRSASEAARMGLRVAAYLQADQETSPAPYKLSRALHWWTLEQLPPSENGATRIPAPAEQRRIYLTGLLERGEYKLLVQEAEEVLSESPFWFDVQRMLVTACDELGPAYADVADAVLQELWALLQRFPKLAGLSFADGTPFADAATKGWLELRLKSVQTGDGAAAAAPTSGTATDQRLAERFEEARARLAKSDLAGALQLMEEGGDGDEAGRDRFRRRLYVATLCMTGGKPSVARPVLEGLDEQVRTHRLDAWEPGLALQVWTHLYRCYESLAGSDKRDKQDFRGRADEVFARICQLDARYALSLSDA